MPQIFPQIFAEALIKTSASSAYFIFENLREDFYKAVALSSLSEAVYF